MTEKPSVSVFDRNYPIICEKIENAAKSVGKTADDIILLAATKTRDADTVNHAIRAGIKYIGENRVQEFREKQDLYLPVHKHFIGRLQSNKVKYIVGKCELIHSVDSFSLAKCISDFALKHGVVQDVLLEVNIGDEQTKAGYTKENISEEIIKAAQLGGIRIRGLMAIPPRAQTPNGNAAYFENMYKMFIDNKTEKVDNVNMDILSMGMSDDYECAVKCGANLVRLGTALFGERNYTK